MSEVSFDGLPCVRLKKVRHLGELVVQETDFYVQDNKLSNALKVLKELIALDMESEDSD